MMRTNIFLIALLVTIQSQSLYNHDPSSFRNASWMGLLDNGIPLRKLSVIGTHNSMSTGTWGDAFQSQASSLRTQMDMGIRAIDIRCRHSSNTLRAYDRFISLNANLGDVFQTVRQFLTTNPKQVILIHIVEQSGGSGSSRSFQATFVSYKNSSLDIIWQPTSQNPFLGQVRGKAVIIQNFVGAVHGLLYSTFTSLPHKVYRTNWDQYDKWTDVKNFLAASATAGQSRISFWTGHTGSFPYLGSFPYFVASGKSSPGNNHPRLATGLTTPGFKKSYPDFPRVACFIGICTIAFEGINILGYNYIVNNNVGYTGIIFTDFMGDDLIRKLVGMNQGRFTPCPATKLTIGCSYCSSTGVCLGCDRTKNYVYDTTNRDCLAAKGYYLSWINSTANQALLCSLVMKGCLECTTNTTCTVCDQINNYQLRNGTCAAAPGYYLDSNSTPIVCNLTGCYRCLSATICSECSTVNNYIFDSTNTICQCDSPNYFTQHSSAPSCICVSGRFLSSSGTCDLIPLCDDPNSGCSNSSCTIGSPNSCSSCDTANNFVHAIFDPSYCACADAFFFNGSVCIMCNTTLSSACQTCASSTVCLSCNANFTLSKGDCKCLPQYYLSSPNTCLFCPVGCLRCSSATNCSICDNSFVLDTVSGVCQCDVGTFLNGTTCLPCGAMAGCIDCDQNGCISCDAIFGFILNTTTSTCQCNYGNFINNMSVCQPCTEMGCLNCLSNQICIQCDSTLFTLNITVCSDICGDGLLYNLPCDDNNTIDGDGCSSSCQIQQDYNCIGGTTTSPSECSYSGPILLTIRSMYKDPSSNTVTMKTSISPALGVMSALNFTQALIPDFPVTSKTHVYDNQTGTVTTVFTYDTSLNAKTLSVNFEPPNEPAYFYMPRVSATLPYTTSNNLALKSYSEQQYQLEKIAEILTWILAGSAVAVFLFCFFFISKLMGVQMLMIFQISYCALTMLQKLQLLMTPLRNLWIVNGYNPMFSDDSQGLPSRLSSVYYKGAFLANFNIDIVIVLLPIIAGAVLLIISKITGRKGIRLKSYVFFKDWLLSALLFAQIHLNFSTILSAQYSSSKGIGLALGIVIECLIILEIVLYIVRPKNFGEYKSFFKQGSIQDKWYVVVFLERSALIATMSILGSNDIGIYVALGICAVCLVLQLIVRPYEHNIRPFINWIFITIVLGLYMFVKLNQDSENVTIMTSYVSFFIIGVLFAALLFNLVCIVMKFISDCRGKQGQQVKTLEQSEREILDLDKQYLQQIKKQLKQSFKAKNSLPILQQENSEGIQLQSINQESKVSKEGSLSISRVKSILSREKITPRANHTFVNVLHSPIAIQKIQKHDSRQLLERSNQDNDFSSEKSKQNNGFYLDKSNQNNGFSSVSSL